MSFTITKKLDKVKESTQKLGEVIKDSQTETPQLAIENTLNHQPKESNERVVYDVELENTFKNMTGKTGFLKHIMIVKVVGCGMAILLKYQVEQK